MDALAASGGAQRVIDDFSATFQKEFVQLLSRRFGTRRVRANQVYQEYIADRHHTHMNATQWTSLSEFVKHLGREGIVQAEDTEQGWYLTWIDNSPAALARQDALQKMERAKMDDEQRQRRLLQEQIERAAKLPSVSDSENINPLDKAPVGLQRNGSEPIRIGLSLGSLAPKSDQSANDATASEKGEDAKEARPSSAGASTALQKAPGAPASAPFKMGFNVLKSTSKPANPLKQAGSVRRDDAQNKIASSGSSSGKAKPPSSMTMAEKIMHEELERKKRKAEPSLARSTGPQMQQGIKRSRF
ncbi:hypothetical protein [Sporisorium scitamineum]|nr:hypothetical protein [Sporisorium scitamineum]